MWHTWPWLWHLFHLTCLAWLHIRFGSTPGKWLNGLNTNISIMHLVKSCSWRICTFCLGQQSLENPPSHITPVANFNHLSVPAVCGFSEIVMAKIYLTLHIKPSFSKMSKQSLVSPALRHEVPKCEKKAACIVVSSRRWRIAAPTGRQALTKKIAHQRQEYTISKEPSADTLKPRGHIHKHVYIVSRLTLSGQSALVSLPLIPSVP